MVTGVVDTTVNGAVPVATVDLITLAFTLPVTVVFPPTLISCETPIPPRVVIEPVNALTEGVESVTFILFIVDTPFTFNLPYI